MCAIPDENEENLLIELDNKLKTAEGPKLMDEILQSIREESAHMEKAARVEPHVLLEPITF
jgi:hypothetical protein